MTPAEPALVGVDFTSDRLRLLLGTVDGEVILRQEFDLPEIADEAAWAYEVGGRISTAFATDGESRWAMAVGVACPGTLDTVSGTMTSASDQRWVGLRPADALRRHINVPVVALGRAEAALRGEAANGAAAGAFDALYVALDARPSAAIMSSARIVAGARGQAGALAAFPTLEAGRPLAGDDLERATALLADVTALLDPALVIVHGRPEHRDPLLPVLQAVMAEIGPPVIVTEGALGDYAALLGAFQAASIVAFEGERADEYEADDDES